jgi:hypothetical protein
MADLEQLLERVIKQWTAEDIPILPGVEDAEIARFENRYGVKLPVDMRQFYQTVNGMGDYFDGEWFLRIWTDLYMTDHSITFAIRLPIS